MALLKKTQRSFAGGQLDKDLMGRQDLAKYSQGCRVLENFKVRKQGNVIKRSGTDLVCDFTNILRFTAVQTAKLIPLVQDRDDGRYILMTGGHAYLVSDKGVKTHYGTWTREPVYLLAYSIPIPFADEDLQMLDWCQSGDTVFFAHRNYPPGKIVYSRAIETVEGEELDNSTLAYEKIEFGPASDYRPEMEPPETSGFPEGESTKYEEYCVTAVKDEVESLPSEPVAVLHSLPWSTESSVVIRIKDDAESAKWDHFNIYKKAGATFGLIGATSALAGDITQPGIEFDGDTKYPNNNDITFSLDAFLRSRDDNSLSAVVKVSGSQGAVYTPGRSYENTKTINVPPTEEDGQTTYRTIDFDSILVRQGLAVCTIEKDESGSVVKWKAVSATFYASLAQKLVLKLFDENDSEICNAEVDLGARQTKATSEGSADKTYNFNGSQLPKVSSSVSAEDCARLMAEEIERKDPNVRRAKNAVFKLPSVFGKKLSKITIAGFRPYTNQEGEEEWAAAKVLLSGMEFASFGNNRLSFVDDYITPDTSVTPPKSEEHFNETGKYPACVAIYQQRLVYASSDDDPFTFWMSRTGDLYNFDSHDYVRADDAIKASTAALEAPWINRMLVHRDLMLFSDGGEWQVAPSAGNAVAPSTIAAKLQSAIGCAPWLKPIPLDADIVFCDASGEALLATRYNFASDGYESSNLSVLSQRMFRNNRIMAMAFVQFPEPTIECVLQDGTVASLVYMKEHDVCAWSLQRLGGGWTAFDVAANKSVVGGSSHCAFIARREAGAKWAILSLRDIDPNDETLAGNLRMDAMRTVTVAHGATPPAAGQGETVVKVGAADGGDTYAVGCTFKSVLKTTSPEFSDKETAQMEIKNATESEVRVIDGSDFTVRQPEVPPQKATRMKVPSPVDETKANFTVELGDADRRMPLVGTNATNGSIVLEHDGYLPLAVLSVSTSYRVEFANNPGADRNGGEL